MDHKTAWQTLRDYAEGRIGHTNAGNCPDHVEGHDNRDSDCLVCQALDAARCLAHIEEPAQPVCWIRFCSDGSTEGPIMDSRICDVRKTSGAWTPLYAGAAPAAVAGPAPAGWRLVPAAPTREWIAAVADGGYEDCNCASLISDILSRAPAAPALEAPAAPDLRKTRDKAGILHYLTPEQMAEEIVRLDARLAASPQAPAAPSLGRSVAQAMQSLQEMWDDLEKSGSSRANARAMRYYSEALSTVERALQAAPAAPAVDADGEAFRAAADLGLTLRFYGGCAQSGMPGSPSVYEVVDGADRAASMREAIQRAAQAAAKGA